jgi:hypothetical protein
MFCCSFLYYLYICDIYEIHTKDLLASETVVIFEVPQLGLKMNFSSFLLNFPHSTLVIREIINLMGKCLQEEKYFAAPLNDYCIRQDVRGT